MTITVEKAWEGLNKHGIYTEELNKELENCKINIGMFTQPINNKDKINKGETK